MRHESKQPAVGPGGDGIVHTERGLTIAGTRITLYDVMDYVTAGWRPEEIAGILPLPRAQVDAALDYIDAHRSEIDEEYQVILRQAREEQAFWDERNRERTERIRREQPLPEKAEVVMRLRRRTAVPS